jgi:hypothetical protein
MLARRERKAREPLEIYAATRLGLPTAKLENLRLALNAQINKFRLDLVFNAELLKLRLWSEKICVG